MCSQRTRARASSPERATAARRSNERENVKTGASSRCGAQNASRRGAAANRQARGKGARDRGARRARRDAAGQRRRAKRHAARAVGALAGHAGHGSQRQDRAAAARECGRIRARATPSRLDVRAPAACAGKAQQRIGSRVAQRQGWRERASAHGSHSGRAAQARREVGRARRKAGGRRKGASGGRAPARNRTNAQRAGRRHTACADNRARWPRVVAQDERRLGGGAKARARNHFGR